MKQFRTAFLIALGWLLFITILLCTSGSKLPKIGWSDKIFLDKWAHLFLFLVLVILWCRVYLIKVSAPDKKKIFVIITILSVAYGIGMEFIQEHFIPFRSFDYGDMIADALGSVAGYFIAVKQLLKK